ncbi:hypothetical protein F2P56_018960, partial [Juglans regia]
GSPRKLKNHLKTLTNLFCLFTFLVLEFLFKKMSLTTSSRKQGENQPDDGASPAKPPRIKIGKSSEDSDKKGAHRRVKDVEICVPIVYGTIAFYLGRKASESQSHKWTVYVRGATNEDLGVVIKRVVFQLHPSFNNPTRVLESPPFELSECGWGEFEIGISLFFHNDICDKQLDL